MEIKLGRGSSNSIIINDKAISREHAVFKINEGSIIIEDLNSTNGTFVNGHRVKIARISKHDKIQFGRNYIFDWRLLDNLIAKSPNYHLPNYKYKKNNITFGRDVSNDIVIDNIRISRKHGVFTFYNGLWYVEDLNSLNGIFINGKRVRKNQITVSDRISVGGINITLSQILDNRIQPDQKITLAADSLSYSIQDKKIIDNLSFTIYPGEFVGLIGESGSGKTTLLTILNGYIKPNRGSVLLNLIDIFENINEFKGLTGYVPQEDIIHKELNVSESLKYSAELRFDGKLNDGDIESHVKKILRLLNLEESKETIIGSPEKKGLSGGQRKRVNLGQELISEPSLLFLDEPTSGLDPRSDREVMDLLKKLTNNQKTIIMTTHNISTDNFNIFTHLIVLTKGGKLAYFGNSEGVYNYFGVNEPIKIFDKLKEKDSNYWKQKYLMSDIYKSYVDGRKQEKKEIINSQAKNYKLSTNFRIKQFITLCKRNLVVKYRDVTSTMILLLQAPIIAFLISIVFSRADQKTEALFVLVIASIWLGCSNSIREIVSEQSIFKRERKVGLNINSYLLSKYAILSFLCLIQCLILSGIVSEFINIDDPISLFIMLFITSISSLSLGLFISSLSKTNETAIALIPIILIPEVVLGGLISIFDRMPDLIKILAGFMLSRWSFEAALISQFGNNQLVSSIGFDANNFILDNIVIVLFGIVFFVATSYILRMKDRVV